MRVQLNPMKIGVIPTTVLGAKGRREHFQVQAHITLLYLKQPTEKICLLIIVINCGTDENCKRSYQHKKLLTDEQADRQM